VIPTGPDARTYGAQARALLDRRSFRPLVDRFLEEPDAKSYPSPLRWRWLPPLAATIRFGQRAPTIVSAALCPLALGWATLPVLGARRATLAVVLACGSPLLWTMGRRALQDAPVALATLLAFGAALRHEPLGLALAVFCLLGLKEASLFALPALLAAWVLSGGAALPAAASCATALAAWLVATRLLLGSRTWEVLRRARSGHDTDYTRKHQSGGPLRLASDLFLCSPLVVLAGASASAPPALAYALVVLLACHALAPVVNARFVLAGEHVLRALAACFVAAHSLALLPAFLAVDAFVAWKLRRVYDPVTSALTTSLGMA